MEALNNNKNIKELVLLQNQVNNKVYTKDIIKRD